MGSGPGPKRKILVVEDEELLVDVLRRTLSDLLVEVATDGKEAWQKLNEETYDLLIADLNIPGIHGRDLLRMMLDKGIDVPTLIISGLPLPREIASMLEGSHYSVMIKPFLLGKIRERVMNMLKPPGPSTH